MNLPRYIGLCGNPGSGKSEVQNILRDRYGVKPIDDGFAFRDIGMRHFGMSHDDVYTQAGKRRSTLVKGEALENRDILGRIGLALECEFGTDITHFFATRELPAGGSYSFGSVRRNAAAIKRDGGMLIAVRNPLTVVRQYDFDGFPIDLIDVWIENDAQARGLHGAAGLADLENKIVSALGAWNVPTAA